MTSELQREAEALSGRIQTLAKHSSPVDASPWDDDALADAPHVATAAHPAAAETVPANIVPGGQPERPWPELHPLARHGLAGEFLDLVGPHTEADPPALLFEFLTVFGSAVGRGPHAVADGARHGAHLFVTLVGKTSSGRKGTAHARVVELFRHVDPEFLDARSVSGLGSGEVVVHRVTDGRVNDEGQIEGAVEDKRLVVVEQEYARILKVSQREGSILSAVLRVAWDGTTLECASKSAPDRATGAHINLVGHVTRTELQRYLTDTEVANGFANRFLHVLTRRSKKLPEGGAVPESELKALAKRVAERLLWARAPQPSIVMERDADARAAWALIYDAIPDADGLFGAVTARAAPQMLRLSVTYALLDGTFVIQREHVIAALAAYLYAQDSAQYLFGARAGDPIEDRLVDALARAGTAGLDFSAQSAVFDRNVPAATLERVRAELERRGDIQTIEQKTRGRSRWISRYVGTKETNQDPLRKVLEQLCSSVSSTSCRDGHACPLPGSPR